MKLIVLMFALLPLSAFAQERSPDWDEYEVPDNVRQVSYLVSSCMAQKTLRVKVGTEHSFAMRFYRKCMAKHAHPNKAYSDLFKRNTIGRFHYILRRTEQALNSLRA